MDNPDNEYKMALIDGRHDYLISGKLTSDRHIYLQSVYGQPGVGDAGNGTFAGTVTGEDIEFGPDGNFSIHVSAKPSASGNWLKTGVGVETILLRYTDVTWDNSTNQDWITIACLTCPSEVENLNPEKLADLLNRTSASFHDRTSSWVSIANRVWTLMPINKIGKPRKTPNGLTDQYSAFGKFDLLNDQA